jgi:hypothetical protein
MTMLGYWRGTLKKALVLTPRYTGHVHLDPEVDPTLAAIREASDYDLTLLPQLKTLLPTAPTSDEALANVPYESLGIAVDASKMGNEARFCNVSSSLLAWFLPRLTPSLAPSFHKQDYRGVPPTTPSITLIPTTKPGKPRPHPKSRPNGFFHSLRTTTLTTAPVLDSNKTTPAERMKADKGELRMGIFAAHEIGKGEEILISYGKSFWSSRMGEDSW